MINNKIEITYEEYCDIFGESAAKDLIAKWYKSSLATDLLLSLPTTFMVDGVHKLPSELGMCLKEFDEIVYFDATGKKWEVNVEHVKEIAELIKNDPNFLLNRPITVREIQDNAIENQPHLSKYPLFIEDGLHRSVALAYLFEGGKFTLERAPVIFAQVKNELINRKGRPTSQSV